MDVFSWSCTLSFTFVPVKQIVRLRLVLSPGLVSGKCQNGTFVEQMMMSDAKHIRVLPCWQGNHTYGQ